MSENLQLANEVRPWDTMNSDEQAAAYMEATRILRQQAEKHVPPNKPDSPFRLVERSLGYCQDFTEVHFPGKNEASLEKLYHLSSLVMGSEDAFNKILADMAQQHPELDKAKEKVLNGEVVGVITPHGELLDLAMSLTASVCSMEEPRILGNTMILVGPIVKELEIAGYSGIDILREGGDVLIGFPDTDSTRNSGIHPGVINTTNIRMPRRLAEQTRRRGKLIYMAGSGSTDTVIYEGNQISQITMKPVSTATEAIANRQMDWVLPVVVSLHRNHLGARVGSLQKLSVEYSIHDLMEKQLAKLYCEASGIDNINYQMPEEVRGKALRKTAKELGIRSISRGSYPK